MFLTGSLSSYSISSTDHTNKGKDSVDGFESKFECAASSKFDGSEVNSSLINFENEELSSSSFSSSYSGDLLHFQNASEDFI